MTKNREEIINCKIVYHRFTFHDWLTPYKMNAFLEKHNMRHIRFHDLRHTCASLLIEHGVPMEQVN